MASTRQDLKTPVGRLVAGDLYKPNDKDAEGKPLVIKNGPQAGQPRVEFFFALAVAKTKAQWWEEDWGRVIYGAAAADFPRGETGSPNFAWKVKDGDSQVPNRRGKKPCDQEGWKGHWVLFFSGGFAPRLFRLDEQNQPVPWADPEAIKLGDFVEVFGSVSGNGSPNQPGVYLNHSMVCFRGYGPRIVVGPDAGAVGFGAGALPPGASAAPVGTTNFPQPMPGMPAPGAAPAMPPAMPGPAYSAAPAQPVGYPPAATPVGYPGAQAPAPVPGFAPAGVGMPPAAIGFAPPAGLPPAAVGNPGMPPAVPGVPPHPGILTPPAVPGMPPAAPAAPVRVMTAAAGGVAYEAYVAQGWTDAMLVQHGLMMP